MATGKSSAYMRFRAFAAILGFAGAMDKVYGRNIKSYNRDVFSGGKNVIPTKGEKRTKQLSGKRVSKEKYVFGVNKKGNRSGLIRVHKKPHEIKHEAAIEAARACGREIAAKRNAGK